MDYEVWKLYVGLPKWDWEWNHHHNVWSVNSGLLCNKKRFDFFKREQVRFVVDQGDKWLIFHRKTLNKNMKLFIVGDWITNWLKAVNNYFNTKKKLTNGAIPFLYILELSTKLLSFSFRLSMKIEVNLVP